MYFEVNSAPYAASEDSFIGELLARIGVANVVPGKLGPFPEAQPRVRGARRPAGHHDLGPRCARAQDAPGWDRIRAVRDGRVCFFDAEQGDVLVRAGPRMAQAVQLMVDCLQGEGSAQ